MSKEITSSIVLKKQNAYSIRLLKNMEIVMINYYLLRQ